MKKIVCEYCQGGIRIKKASLLLILCALIFCLCGCGRTYRIKIAGGEDLVVSCPKAAKSGDTVTVETKDVTDGWLEVSASGAEVTAVQENVFQFVMPEQNVEVKVLFTWDSSD